MFYISSPLQHQRFKALIAQFLGSPSSADTAADNNGIVGIGINSFGMYINRETIAHRYIFYFSASSFSFSKKLAESPRPVVSHCSKASSGTVSSGIILEAEGSL